MSKSATTKPEMAIVIKPWIKLSVTTQGYQLNLQGSDTFDLKEVIKSVGGKWTAVNKSWTIKLPADLEPLNTAIKTLSAKRSEEFKAKRDAAKAQRLFDASPEGIAKKKAEAKQLVLNALELKKKTGAYYWICCEECEVIDWQRAHTSCNACAVDCGLYKNTFRVRGAIFTGD